VSGIWSATGQANVYGYTVPASAWTSIFDKTTDPAFKEGTHTITVTSYDNANKQTSETYIFVKDVTPPTVDTNNITNSSSSIEDANNPVIRLSISDLYSDLADIYEYRIRTASGAYSDPSWISVTLTDPGKSVNVTDIQLGSE